MGFTTPCFIRKNTPELKKKLEELGYKDYGNLRFYGDPIIIYCNINHFFTSPFVLEGEHHIGKYDNFIDCGDNEQLFLAIAALRDDTPINSWYWFNGKLVKCEKLELKNLSFNTAQYFPKCRDINNPMVCFCADEKLLRKATINEIIKHFKDDKDTIKQ